MCSHKRSIPFRAKGKSIPYHPVYTKVFTLSFIETMDDGFNGIQYEHLGVDGVVSILKNATKPLINSSRSTTCQQILRAARSNGTIRSCSPQCRVTSSYIYVVIQEIKRQFQRRAYMAYWCCFHAGVPQVQPLLTRAASSKPLLPHVMVNVV